MARKTTRDRLRGAISRDFPEPKLGAFARLWPAKCRTASSRLLGGYAAVEKIDGTVRVAGIAGIVGDHADSGAAFVQFGQKLHNSFAVG